ncbi:hypothetical protein GCM10011360_22860 [Primorskyibacter flagellatus]|uniref:Activator of Hsp90 ATPase homologue 1/2-like C-terminal domain-containing protein n=1 Tax=Primorskyibacter flagellatus TaxID=1387277 RepID=A0A917AA57_9RHOB|nr:SRPBCC domain-containing protein [Primorskyibacter flagellatus]GGE34428.1 hypothetical protein GCM10011360_22860 [Primorskyibacter flagellatus]
MTVDLALKLTRTIPAAPEKVFDAWLDPQVMALFLCPGEGTTSQVTNDPTVGGRYDILMEGGPHGEGVPHWGTYRRIDRPEVLEFTWNSPHAEPDSIVTLTFKPVSGGTEVTLVHDRFPSDGARSGHEKGWTSILEKLEARFA